MLQVTCIPRSQEPSNTLKARSSTRSGRKKRKMIWRTQGVSLWSFKNDDNIEVVIYSKIKFNGIRLWRGRGWIYAHPRPPFLYPSLSSSRTLFLRTTPPSRPCVHWSSFVKPSSQSSSASFLRFPPSSLRWFHSVGRFRSSTLGSALINIYLIDQSFRFSQLNLQVIVFFLQLLHDGLKALEFSVQLFDTKYTMSLPLLVLQQMLLGVLIFTGEHLVCALQAVVFDCQLVIRFL